MSFLTKTEGCRVVPKEVENLETVRSESPVSKAHTVATSRFKENRQENFRGMSQVPKTPVFIGQVWMVPSCTEMEKRAALDRILLIRAVREELDSREPISKHIRELLNRNLITPGDLLQELSS